ncbi:hypothetical protein [Streptomyces sp. NPDC003247]|uniref:hypothetical protein n=1 Tax=Streptomyces sp. NPDC003247 TaxID=3364677 RepID=UPI00369E0346
MSGTIDFTPADSGTNGHHVVYTAFPQEKPVLNGGVQVTGWTQHSGNIWQAPLDRDDKLRALYVDDTRATMASKTITSAGCYGTYSVTAGQAPWAWESGSHTFTAKGVPSVPVRSPDDASTTLWLAPAGTTTFAAGATMTKASGTATAIRIPPEPGDYHLYIVDAQGKVSAPSQYVVRQAWTYVDETSPLVTYSSAWTTWKDTQDYGGSEKYTSKAGESFHYAFTESAVRYLGMTQPNMGKVDVYIDGVLARAGITRGREDGGEGVQRGPRALWSARPGDRHAVGRLGSLARSGPGRPGGPLRAPPMRPVVCRC